MSKKKRVITLATTISADGKTKTGGSNVVHELYIRLAEVFDVNVLYIAPYNKKRELKKISEGLTEYVIPRSIETQSLTGELEKALGAATLYDVGLIYYLNKTPEYIEMLRQFIEKSDLVMLDRPYLFPYVHMFSNGRPIIQRSQNVEYYYKEDNLPYSEKRQLILDDLFHIEKVCCNYSDINFSCSEKDLTAMNKLYATPRSKLELLPNGVSVNDNPMVPIQKRKKMQKKFKVQKDTLAMFIGVGHKPNLEAVDTILRIAPFCPRTVFVIAGDVCNYLLKLKRAENIILLGRICEEERKFLFSLVDVALNPMYSGSGSNIKMFDYMSMGIPIISTTFGARGIEDISHIILADTDEEFIRTLNGFEVDNYKSHVAHNRKMVEKTYDWEVISQKTIKILEQIIER